MTAKNKHTQKIVTPKPAFIKEITPRKVVQSEGKVDTKKEELKEEVQISKQVTPPKKEKPKAKAEKSETQTAMEQLLSPGAAIDLNTSVRINRELLEVYNRLAKANSLNGSQLINKLLLQFFNKNKAEIKTMVEKDSLL